MREYFLVFVFVIIAAATAVAAAEMVEINTASLQQLDEITGIGPALAQRIINARPFSSVDDLLRVKGIGEKTLQKIKTQGLAYVSGQIQQPSQEINKSQNINPPLPQQISERTPTPVPATSTVAPIINNIVYPTGIFLNEILPSPKGADETDEWIELYNLNNSDVDLSGWKLQDVAGTIAIYAFPINSKISALGYLVVKRPDTKIMLNNNGDGINLILPNDNILDFVSYKNAPIGQSYSKTNNGWQWSTTLTPGLKNIITSTTKTLPKTKISGNSEKINENLSSLVGAVGQERNLDDNNLNPKKYGNPWILFGTSLITIIILGGVLLALRIKLKKYNVRS